MGVYVKIDDETRYYRPLCYVDSVTDRADEIAIGSDGGSKGYITDSGTQDTPMVLSFAENNFVEVSQGFLFLLGNFSGVWAGKGRVKLKLSNSAERVIFKEFLTDKRASRYNYRVEIVVVDRNGHFDAKELELVSSELDSTIGKYRNTFAVSGDTLVFGSAGASSVLSDLSMVSVYLRGYFYETGMEHIEYVGGGIEFGSEGGAFPFRLRGFSGLSWRVSSPSYCEIDIDAGTFGEGVEYMPQSDVLTLSIGEYTSPYYLWRGANIPVLRQGESVKVTDFIPLCQKSSVVGLLNFSMRTIRHKSPKARTFRFEVFADEPAAWELLSKPDWITASVTSGVGSTTINLTFSDNATTAARAGILEFTETATNQRYQIPCVQLGVERFYAVQNIVSGEKKVTLAPAAILARNSFDMEVSYYNAPNFTVYLRQIGFNISDFISGGDGLGVISMRSGACAGRDFKIKECEYDADSDRWKLNLDRLEDSSVGMVYPNTLFPIKTGDRFVLTEILMPEVYVMVAEKKLLARAKVYYDRFSNLRYLFDLEIDSKWVHKNGVYLRPGMYMQIADSDLIGTNPAFVLIDTVSVTHNESNLPVFKVTLRERLFIPE